MELYFLRHGDAEPEGERPLSAAGRKEVARVAEWLREAGLKPDAVLTSPLLRARQTGEIVARALGMEAGVADLLDSGADAEKVAELVKQAPAGRLLLVGHEPDFSRIIATLTGGAVDMKKAGLARVDCDQVAPGAGTLKWLLPPKLMA